MKNLNKTLDELEIYLGIKEEEIQQRFREFSRSETTNSHIRDKFNLIRNRPDNDSIQALRWYTNRFKGTTWPLSAIEAFNLNAGMVEAEIDNLVKTYTDEMPLPEDKTE